MIRFIIFALIFSQSVFAETTFCGLKVPEGIDQAFRSLNQAFNCSECKDVKTVCPLNQLKQLPKIILVGENHYDETSRSVRSKLFDSAGERKIEIATEVTENGAALPWLPMPSSNVHAIESPVPAAVMASYLIQQRNVEREDIAKTFSLLTANIEANPLFRGAYNAMKVKGTCPECLQKLDATLAGNAHDFSKLVSSLPEKELRDFLTQFHVEAIDIANKKFPEHFAQGKLEYLKSTDDLNKVGLYNKLLPAEGQKTKFDAGFLNLRNRDFVFKISELLCRAEAKSKPLVILVGDAHAPGISKLLENLSDGKAEIKYFKSYEPAQAASLLFETQQDH